MDPVRKAKQLVFGYNENPKDYTDEQAERIAHIAAKLGLPFRPESKALKKFFFDLLDNMTFGALPDDMRPVSRGEKIYGETKGEKLSSNLALLGLAVPGVAGAKIATGAGAAIKKRLPQATQDILNKANRGSKPLTRAGQFGGSLAALDLLEDPMGAPERAFAGAALGGAIGGAGLLRYAQLPTQNRMAAIMRDPMGLRGIGNIGIQI
jgi:hypothetical protein